MGRDWWRDVVRTKFGINTGKESTHGVLGRMDERMSEMEGSEIDS